MTVGKLYDYNVELQVTQGFAYTHVILKSHGHEIDMELDKSKVKELIEMLEKAIR